MNLVNGKLQIDNFDWSGEYNLPSNLVPKFPDGSEMTIKDIWSRIVVTIDGNGKAITLSDIDEMNRRGYDISEIMDLPDDMEYEDIVTYFAYNFKLPTGVLNNALNGKYFTRSGDEITEGTDFVIPLIDMQNTNSWNEVPEDVSRGGTEAIQDYYRQFTLEDHANNNLLVMYLDDTDLNFVKKHLNDLLVQNGVIPELI